jgi:hypothetical protein
MIAFIEQTYPAGDIKPLQIHLQGMAGQNSFKYYHTPGPMDYQMQKLEEAFQQAIALIPEGMTGVRAGVCNSASLNRVTATGTYVLSPPDERRGALFYYSINPQTHTVMAKSTPVYASAPTRSMVPVTGSELWQVISLLEYFPKGVQEIEEWNRNVEQGIWEGEKVPVNFTTDP